MKWIRSEATRDALDNLIGFVLDNIQLETTVSDKCLMETRLICEEVLVNIIDYAYEASDGFLDVGFDYDAGEGIMTLVFKDEGLAFDPTDQKDPDMTQDIMEREIGGLGIYMVKKLSLSVAYSREDISNILTVRKQVKQSDEK